MADRKSTPETTPETTVERVYEQLKAMAISFEFPPGSRVNEIAVAKKIGVSRTPLREALNRLTADGFLTLSRQQGFFRKPLSVKAVEDLYELREQMERGVIRMVLKGFTDAGLDEIESFLTASSQMAGKTSQELLALDEKFHERLAALSGNVEMVEALRKLNERIRFVRWIEIEGRQDFSFAPHLAIVQALRNHDADRAEALMIQLISAPRDSIVNTVKDAFARIYMNREETFIPPV